ncbi:NLRC3 [Symbiodinium natans]|uniref:NLRC3 protein n=1 Tax=Symbiodinium natans TaxID=878477 RepID=A0A812HTB1_9DINO|nr:NLRC3 [Symbiodinium natans]
MDPSSLRQELSEIGAATEQETEAVSEISRSYVKNLLALHGTGTEKTSTHTQGETAAGPQKAEEYSLTNPKDLQSFLVEANIRPVRVEFLFKLAKEGRVWPRRQEAEREMFEDANRKMRTALVTMEELQDPNLYLGPLKQNQSAILSVSHTWEAQQHPDPWGWQLRSLLRQLESLGLSREECKHEKRKHERQCWIFLDFMCLHQYRRNDEQEHLFKKAMRSMHLLYAHDHINRVVRLEELTPESEKTMSGSIGMYCEATGKFEERPRSELVLNSTPYGQRGWCIAEVQWMSTKDRLYGYAPMAPEDFQERVRRGEQALADGLVLVFTHRSDAGLVSQLQEEVFLQQARQRRRLAAYSLPQREMAILATALPHLVNLESLEVRKPPEGFTFGPSIFDLARGLQRLRPEKLMSLWVEGDGIGDEGAAALASAMASCKALAEVEVASDDIGDAGAEALAAAVVACKALRRFELRKCYRIGEAGVRALAAASKAAPQVVFKIGQHVSRLADSLHHEWGTRNRALDTF